MENEMMEDVELGEVQVDETPMQSFSSSELKEKAGVEQFIMSNPQLATAVTTLQANNISLDAIIDSDPELKSALNYLANNNVTLNDVIEIPNDGEGDSEAEDFSDIDVLTIDDDSVSSINFDDIKEENESTSTADLSELF